MKLRLLLVAAVAAALPIIENEKRDDTVYQTTTQAVGWAQLFGLSPTSTQATVAAVSVAATTATTPVAVVAATTAAIATPATTAAAAAATTTSGGFLSSLRNFFEGLGSDSSTTSTTAAAATTTAAATSTSSGLGWFSSLLLSLFGGSSSLSSSTTAAATGATVAASTLVGASSAAPLASSSATAATSTSGGLLSGLFGSSESSAASVVSGSSSASGGALSGDISKVAAYAEEGAGITYSPYTKSGLCKTASEVKLDIDLLLSYKIIRLYSVDCSGIENVVSAISSLQKLFLGVWDIDNLSNDLPSLAEQVLTGSRGWSAVHTVAIGNELVNAGTKTVAQIKTAVSTARLWFKTNASGYSGYIVSVDTLAAVMADSSMCDISDYLAVNCHPYFSGIEALTSGSWLKSQVQSLLSHCNNGKNILITESGWPTFGDTLGLAVPSEDDQYLAIKSIASTMGSQVIMFTTYNDYWKDPGSYNVEQHWGIYGDPSA